jgi:hypothetical protein
MSINEIIANTGGGAQPNYYRDIGIYSGDILIRFFWRKKFVRNFEY